MRMLSRILLFLTAVLFHYGFADMHSMNGTVYYDSTTSTYSIKLGLIDCNNGVACGFFNDTLNITGWGMLEIKTTKNSSVKNINDVNRMYASGYLEGYITSYQIINSYLAGWDFSKPDWGKYTQKISNWTQQQALWIKQQIKNNPHDAYWKYVEGLQAQYDGLKDGYNAASNDFKDKHLPPLTDDFVWQFLNGNAEFFDLITYFQYFGNGDDFAENNLFKHMNDWRDKDPTELYFSKLKQSHCSALVKVTPELDDIFFSHSTWSDYCWLGRIIKRYIFDLNETIDVSSTEMLMSSYPGALSSIDDYYLMNNGMAVTETTNLIYNNSIYSVLTPNSLFVWQRARIANALADNGKQWCETFGKYNSGTYNNQWMILNHKLFKKGKELSDQLLYILEQVPGNISIKDVTNELERGYWASYNVPAIKYIYRISGNEEMAKKDGVYMSYDLAPRARIFRRDANNVLNMNDNKKLMRYNNYTKDPIEQDNVGWAIMSRYDLNKTNPGAFGGVDTKAADLNMLRKVTMIAQNGPTHDDLPPFSFVGGFSNYPHNGLPTKIDFDWIHAV